MVPGRVALAMITLFTYMSTVEPLKQGPIHVEVRRNSVLIEREQIPPTVTMAYPHDNEQFTGQFLLNTTNWTVTPRTGIYANGIQTRNQGFVSGCVYNNLGERIREYDHVTVLPNGVLQIEDAFADGDYKAYFQLRRKDGTPVIQAAPSVMNDIVSVVFYVGDRGGPPPDGDPPPDDGPPPPPPDGGPPPDAPF